MNLNNLKYLEVLVEEKNITRAAARLYITQPTMTAFINRLENELGVRLFDRSHSPVELTNAGKIYMSKIRSIVLEEEKLTEELRELVNPHEQVIIGIGQVHSQIFGPKLIQLMLQTHPDLNIRLAENKEITLMKMLKEGSIDLFVGHTNLDTVNFVFEEIADETLCLIVPNSVLRLSDEEREQSWIRPYPVNFEQLENIAMIIPDSTQGIYLNFSQWMNQSNFVPSKRIGTANTITAATLVAMGLGVAISADSIVKRLEPDMQKNIVNCSIPGMVSVRKCYASYLKNSSKQELIKETINLIKQVIK